MALDLTGQRQTKGYLQALELLGAKDNNGLLWRCLCHFCGGKNYRDVLARDFVSNRIKKCKECVRPQYRAQQQSVVRVIKKKRAAKGAPFRSANPEFRRDWKLTLARFSPRRRLLFETILNGRDANKEFRFQALDWALQIPERDLDLELKQFSQARLSQAAERLRPSGSKLALAA